MVAAVSGTTYEQQLQEQIFGPLGLTRTSLPVGPVLPTPFVRGYDVPESGSPEDLSEVMAAGWAWARLRRRQALRHPDAERAAGGHSWRRLGAARPGS